MLHFTFPIISEYCYKSALTLILARALCYNWTMDRRFVSDIGWQQASSSELFFDITTIPEIQCLSFYTYSGNPDNGEIIDTKFVLLLKKFCNLAALSNFNFLKRQSLKRTILEPRLTIQWFLWNNLVPVCKWSLLLTNICFTLTNGCVSCCC